MFKSELNGQLKRLFLALEYVLQTKEKRYSMFMYVSSLFQQEQRRATHMYNIANGQISIQL